MRFFDIGTLAYVSAMLRVSAASFDLLGPDHAVAELLVVPANVTIMTPRARKPGFDQQLFDFGSAQTGFSELKRVFQRQACETGTGACPNDAGVCCPLEIDAATRRRTDATARDAVQKGKNAALAVAVARAATIALSSAVFPGAAQPAKPAPQLLAEQLDMFLAKGKTSAVVASGTICYRDLGNEPRCRYPNDSTTTSVTSTAQITTSAPPDTSTSSTPAEPSTTSTPDITSSAPEVTPTPTPTEQITTSVSTPPQVTTRVVVTTAPQVSSRLPPIPEASIEESSTTTETSRSQGTNATVSSNSSSVNIGAIAGGTVAGVVAIAALIIILIFWRRRRADYAQAPTGPAPEPDMTYNQPAHERPYDHWHPIPIRPTPSQGVHRPEPAPPTPGIGDPFLTPNMARHQSVHASYFDAGHTSPGPSGTDTGAETQYSGLPEPQQPDYLSSGPVALAGPSVMPSPRRDGAHPRPLSMTVTPLQGSANNSTSWSGYGDNRPCSGLNATGYAGYPEVENNTSQPRWSPAPPALNVPQYDRPPSTVYQRSSHDGAAYDNTYAPSPPPVNAYGVMAPSTGGNGGPSGTATPGPSASFAPPPY